MAWKLNPFSGDLDYYESGSGLSIGASISGATTGSVLFAGSGPVLAQDNSGLFWDASNNFLGIGTASPRSGLEMQSGPPLFLRGITGLGLIDDYWGTPLITGAFQVDAALYYGMVYIACGNDYYGVWQEFVKSRSTDGSNYAIVQADDELGRFNFYGDLGGALYYGARFNILVDGTPGSGSLPARMEFNVGEAGSTIPTLRLTLGAVAGNMFTPGKASRPGLRVKGHSGQSANLQTWEDSSETVLVSIGPSGSLKAEVSSASAVPIIAKGAASQSADLLQVQNSGGSVLVNVHPSGAIQVASLADADAPNSSFYYSTTSSRLAWKDSGGTKRDLY